MPVPGEVMFSDEWMRRNSARRVPPMFAKMCRDLCKDQNLGNDNSIEMVWITLRPHIKEIVRCAYELGAQAYGSDEDTFLGDKEFVKEVDNAAEEFVDPTWIDNQGN